ncbi:hypothetical protein NE865_09487 [Phthorimaea operculella]|nr:hypothetical protein NE865_09487 [Phthorimaea operculella]
MQCQGCHADVTTYVKCTVEVCKSVYCKECVGINTLTPNVIKGWVCHNCVAEYKRKSDSTPSKDAYAPGNVALRGKQKQKVDTAVLKTDNIQDTPSDISMIMTELQHLRAEVAKVAEQNQEIKAEMTRLSTTLKQTVEEHEIKMQQAEIEIATLKTTIEQLHSTVGKQEQDSMRNDLEIIGVTEHKGENLKHIVQTAANKVGVELTELDIDDVMRVGRKAPSTDKFQNQLPRPVVVKLLRKCKRDEIINAARTRHNITSENIVEGAPTKLYFNERLTKTNRQLFRETRLRANKHGFRYCWLRYGCIFVRKSDGKPAIRISSSAELDQKVGPPPVSTKE